MQHEDITALLDRWERGDSAAEQRLLELVYPELKKIAARRLPDTGSFPLDTTDLVHEAYLALQQQHSGWRNRSQFFAIAARLMRRIVTDRIRHRGRLKRGGDAKHLSLDQMPELEITSDARWLDLDAAIDELAGIDERCARIVDLRFFVGLTAEETGDLLHTSPATVARGWRFAKAWLAQRLAPAPP